MKIAFVSPWYGTEIPGGAEAEVRRTAEHLSEAGLDIEVLTTCVREFHADWNTNHHRPGTTIENGVIVRRFRVRRANANAFAQVNAKLMQNREVTRQEELIYVQESVRSRSLERHIAKHRADRLFVFIPYMFGTTYWGLRACQGSGLLIPCLHDDSYARMGVFQEMFESARRVLFHSQSEAQLAHSLYRLAPDVPILMGEGVDTDWVGNSDRFRAKYGIEGPFLLYAGRKDRGKNVGDLIDYFRSYRQARNERVELILIGGGELPRSITEGEGIRDLGFVPLQDKFDAYAASTALCQPSLQESFSLVLMEAWVAGRPALVHADCEVTKEHCLRSNGGLFFRDFAEFSTCMDVLLKTPVLADGLGTNGRRYVLENYQWQRITERYTKLFETLTE